MTRTFLRAAAALGIAASVVLDCHPAMADEIREQQWHLRYLDVAEAHRHSQGEGVVIAIIDTGVDANHPDLRRNVLNGTDIVPGGTGDGRADADGHGTAMAALAAGHGHGTRDGILGIAPKAKILPIRIHSPSRTGDTNDGARAIEWAIDHGANVICDASSGGVTLDLLRAVQRGQRSGMVVVAAAGNRPRTTGVGAPASFPGVIAAAAVDGTGNHHPNSVTGPEIVLAAPGVETMSAINRSRYAAGTGTSDAAAIIAGAVALVRAKYPDLPAEEVIHRLTATATDKGPPGRDEQYGYGVLNLVSALTADVPPLKSPSVRSVPPTVAAAPPNEPAGDGRRPDTGLVALLILSLAVAAGTFGVLVARTKRGDGE